MRRKKMLGLLGILAGGTVFHLPGCTIPGLGGLGGFNDFFQGFLAKGFVNNVWLDVITDWLREDLFS